MCRRKSVHPNHVHSHRQFRTSLLQKLEIIPKKATPSNDSQQFPFSARILQYSLHCYGENFRARSADHLVAQQIFQFQTNHIYNHTGKKETIASLIIAPTKHVCLGALINKLGLLAQGKYHVFQFNDTINFIFRSEFPRDRSVAYASFVCDYNPLKSEPYLIHCVAIGDKLDYPDDPVSPASYLIGTKFLLNSTISDAKKISWFMSYELKNFFLASPMEQSEYL